VVFEIEGLGGLSGLLELVGRLADIDGDADDLVVLVLLFENRHADGRIETAAERQCHALCHYPHRTGRGT
jgi:hypothetical protein